MSELDPAQEHIAPEQLVGRHVLVQWSDKQYYLAVVLGYNQEKKVHSIVYVQEANFEHNIKFYRLKWKLLPRKLLPENQPFLAGAPVHVTDKNTGITTNGMIFHVAKYMARPYAAFLHEETTCLIDDRYYEWCCYETSPSCALSWNKSIHDFHHRCWCKKEKPKEEPQQIETTEEHYASI